MRMLGLATRGCDHPRASTCILLGTRTQRSGKACRWALGAVSLGDYFNIAPHLARILLVAEVVFSAARVDGLATRFRG
jgi:hypothetical protein